MNFQDKTFRRSIFGKEEWKMTSCSIPNFTLASLMQDIQVHDDLKKEYSANVDKLAENAYSFAVDVKNVLKHCGITKLED